ncbi:hypothetical protein J7K93_10560 [bacterium]|nr:hypothetical protein [bacterium]
MKLQNLEMPVPSFIRGKGTISPINSLLVLTRLKTNTRPWFLIPKEFLSGNPFLFKVLTTVSISNSFPFLVLPD